MTRLHDSRLVAFASDNYAGVHPDVLSAIAAANEGHVTAYGDDPYTRRLDEVVRGHFGAEARAYAVFNGTGANVVALTAMTPRWGAVLCADTAHINTDEAGAPESVGGVKLMPLPARRGKLTPEAVESEAWGQDFVHRAAPSVVSISQSTELGTLYTPEEIAGIAEAAHAGGMTLHMDGARIANAAAALGASLKEMTSDAGVDVLSLGATKNGALFGDAVVVLNPEAAPGVERIRKSQMQLASKARFAAAQLVALFGTDLWLENARHANAMAERLGQALAGAEGVELAGPPEANALFATLDRAAAERVRERFPFYDWDEARGQVRWMTAFDTREADVDAFAALVRAETAGPRRA
ncbi:threonine aldolase family protein [Falsarthrobacter nasiphocae]|uniref:Threonine aldolase n=1 Tax=Falsarthrobacter nasiphocae TaxID=189863 RepID=A0AAE4C7A3_9MICC|nr:beta-eliminating lyase-related protein [Falsarthrobacter nasiphocae]MDR6891250.1 threonine aldolase [Falsarthrobacter nasiphocae]